MKNLMDWFIDLQRSGAEYDPLNNTFRVKPENVAAMQANDWATRQHEEFMREMDRKPLGFNDDL